MAESLPSITSRGQSHKPVRKTSGSPRKKNTKIRTSDAEDTEGSV